MGKIRDLMGKIVTVQQEYRRRVSGNHKENITWEPVDIPTPRAGWVVGQRSLQEGELIPISRDEGSYLRQFNRVPCILVVYWPTLKPVNVPLDGYLINPDDCPCECNFHAVPHSPSGSPKDREVARKTYADKVECYPRDARGRFVT